MLKIYIFLDFRLFHTKISWPKANIYNIYAVFDDASLWYTGFRRLATLQCLTWMKCILMFFQTCFRDECFITHWTLERVLARVATLVGYQVSPPAKTQATLRALVRSLSCVNPLVNFKHTMLTESFPTIRTFKWLLLQVDFCTTCWFLRSTLLLCGSFWKTKRK